MLATLHYDSKWVEYGFLDEESLKEQVSRYKTGVDENTEHYRYSSFCSLLDRAVQDTVTLDRFIELADLDADQTMARAALGQLVRHSGLATQQLNYLKSHPSFASPILQTILDQTLLLRELHSSDLSDDLFNRCLSSGKDGVQRTLLDHSRISKEQVETLSEHGATRAIRNLAKQKLTSIRLPN